MFNYRTTTNVPTQRNPQQQDNGDADTGADGAAEADGGGASDNMEQGQSAQNYDARKARNAKSKRREEIDNFQAKILKIQLKLPLLLNDRTMWIWHLLQ